jgi:hypothetical protein
MQWAGTSPMRRMASCSTNATVGFLLETDTQKTPVLRENLSAGTADEMSAEANEMKPSNTLADHGAARSPRTQGDPKSPMAGVSAHRRDNSRIGWAGPNLEAERNYATIR